MRALLLKDGYVLLRQGRLMLVFVIVFSLLYSGSLAGIAVTYAAMLPYTAIAYDERSKWDIYAAMMPYSTTALVLEKYLLGWLAILASALLTLCAQLLLGTGLASTLAILGSSVGMGLLLLAFTLPAIFRFGVEKGRMIFFAGYFIAVALTSGLNSDVIGDIPLTLFLPALPVAMLTAGVLAQLVSLPLARRLYARAHRI